MIVSDNGSEFTSNAILAWADKARVEWHYIAPGKPMQNAFIESFMYGRPLRCKAIVRLGQGAGRVRSCMRPVGAAHLMTAGPDGVRGSMPHQRDALCLRLKLCGLYSIPGPPGRAITSLSPSQL
jgi:transposase InsO family protein